MPAAIKEAERIRDEVGAWMPNQFTNPANPRIHYETTGPELWTQLGGRLDAFVYGSGTGGTISGDGRYFKEKDPAVRVVAVETARSPVLSGRVYRFRGPRTGVSSHCDLPRRGRPAGHASGYRAQPGRLHEQ